MVSDGSLSNKQLTADVIRWFAKTGVLGFCVQISIAGIPCACMAYFAWYKL